MENRIKAAFDTIRADEKTIRRTRASLRKMSFDYGRDIPAMRLRKFRRLICAAMLAVLLLGAGAYGLPTAAIDIAINPDLELKINAFDKVISAKGLNADGSALIEDMELKNLSYTKALRRIMLSDKMEVYLARGDVLSITVVDGDELNGGEILRNAVCSASAVVSSEDIYYCSVDSEVARAAKELQLSVAGYLALQQLREADPSVSPEQVREMDMREVKQLIGCPDLDKPCDYVLRK